MWNIVYLISFNSEKNPVNLYYPHLTNKHIETVNNYYFHTLHNKISRTGCLPWIRVSEIAVNGFSVSETSGSDD